MGFFLWPFPVLMGFEFWQKRAGCHVRKWFETMGIMESISSLATLKYENPEWIFPVVKKHHEKVEADDMGHPLLHPDSCIENSFVIGPEDTFQMVTGSNMSGKSTLLRSIGLNIILAQAGAPVYAKKMTLPEISLGTSFRIQDSLESGVSFFMAELKRLKEIVDQTEDLKQKEQRKTLYLLDEILQGTNSVERQIAVRHIINRLINLKSIGIISTHDLSLAEAEELKEKCDLLHFTEHYEKTRTGEIMQFDYKLKPGLAPTVNALKLLEIIGLLDER
jgi:DNA mismatch repair ATPase MutS